MEKSVKVYGKISKRLKRIYTEVVYQSPVKLHTQPREKCRSCGDELPHLVGTGSGICDWCFDREYSDKTRRAELDAKAEERRDEIRRLSEYHYEYNEFNGSKIVEPNKLVSWLES